MEIVLRSEVENDISFPILAEIFHMRNCCLVWYHYFKFFSKKQDIFI